MKQQNTNEKTARANKRPRRLPTKLGEQIRIMRIKQGMKTTEEMAKKLGYSKSYLSQVEIGETPPSFDFLTNYIEVFELDEQQAYDLLIMAYENLDRITINMEDLRVLDREHFSRLLAIVKFFPHKFADNSLEALSLKNAIDTIWKKSIPESLKKSVPQTSVVLAEDEEEIITAPKSIS